MIGSLIFLVIGIALVCAYVSRKCRGYTVQSVIWKSWASVCFIGIALCATFYSGNTRFGLLIAAGLVFGILGDIWLDEKYIHSADNDPYTFAGFQSFALGHVCYVAALLLNYADFRRPLWLIIPLVLGIVIGFGSIVWGKVMKLKYGSFARISGIYCAFLGFDALLACSLAIMHGFELPQLNFMAAGLILFTASDLILSNTYFAEGHERPIDFILNYSTYYGGQFLIALAVLFA